MVANPRFQAGLCTRQQIGVEGSFDAMTQELAPFDIGVTIV
jgi:hypothetical protein